MTKAQLTIFIIVGIAVLLSVGVVVYIEQQKIAAPIEEVVIPIIAAVPSEVAPIQDFITGCVKQVGEDGLRIIGERGGYIDTDAAGLKFNPVEPTESDTVELAPSSGLKIPYWWHLSSPNECVAPNCKFDSERPALYCRSATEHAGCPKTTIEKQLDDYVAANIGGCIDDFKQFREQGFEFETGNMNVVTSVAAKTVNFFVEWPIVARQKADGREFRIEQFFSREAVSLKDFYDQATELVNLMMKTNFLDNNALSMIDLYGDENPDAIPPFGNTLIGSSNKVIWIKSKVKEKITQALASDSQLLQVIDSRNFEPIAAPAGADSEIFDAIYNRGKWATPFSDTANVKLFPDIEAYFDYHNWNPYFDLGGCKGEVCQPQSASFIDFLIGIKDYSFAYDLSFPVLVTLYNPDALNGAGYLFQFFMESNIRENAPMKTNYVPLTSVASVGASLFCEDSYLTPYNITVAANDLEAKPVENAMVYFACGDVSCDLGRTNSEGIFKGQFPADCFDGVVRVRTEDSFPANIRLSTLSDEPVTEPVSAVVKPYAYVNVALKKIVVRKEPVFRSFFSPLANEIVAQQTGWDWKPNAEKAEAEPIEKGEHAMIMLTRQQEGDDEEFTAVADLDPAATGRDLSKNIQLVPGKYDVAIHLFKTPENKITIPPQANYKKNDEWCVPAMPGIVFEAGKEMYVGSAEYELQLNASDLHKAKTITFYSPFLDFESVTDKCWVVRDDRHDADKSWAIGKGPVVGEAEGWWCGRGKTRTACERTIDDINMFGGFNELYIDNPDYAELFVPEMS